VRDDLVPATSPLGERPRSSRSRQEIKALNREQAQTLLKAAYGQRNEALYVVALHTGLRQGRVTRLKWADLDLTGPQAVRSPGAQGNGSRAGFRPSEEQREPPLRTPEQDRRGRSKGSQDPPERREATARRPLARYTTSCSRTASVGRWITATSTTASTSPCYKGRARRRGFHLPQPAAHLRDRTL
jgi:hypothetical protein